MKYSELTQEMLDALPAYLKARENKGAVYQQLLTPIANHIEDMQLELRWQSKNSKVNTYLANDLDVVWTLDGDVGLPYAKTTKNNIKDWWIEDYSRKLQILDTISNWSINESFAEEHIVETANQALILCPNKLEINVILNESLPITEDFIVAIEGYDCFNNYTVESFSVIPSAIHTITTEHEYSYLCAIRTHGPSIDATLYVGVANSLFRDSSPDPTFTFQIDRINKNVAWSIEHKTWLSANTVEEYLAGIQDSVNKTIYYLEPIIGEAPANAPISIAASNNDFKLYLLRENNRLHVYDKRDNFPSMVQDYVITKDPVVSLNIQEDFMSSGSKFTIRGIYNRTRVSDDVISYMFFYKTADGSISYWDNEWTSTPKWIGNPITERVVGFYSPIVELENDMSEDLVIGLKTKIRRNNKVHEELDAIFFAAATKTPIQSVAIESAASFDGIGVNSNEAILLSSGSDVYVCRTVPSTYYYDSESNMSIFGYAVEGGVQRNITTDLDHLAVQMGIERPTGMTVYNFRQVLLDSISRIRGNEMNRVRARIGYDASILPAPAYMGRFEDDNIKVTIHQPFIHINVNGDTTTINTLEVDTMVLFDDTDTVYSLMGMFDNFTQDYIKPEVRLCQLLNYSNVRYEDVVVPANIDKLYLNMLPNNIVIEDVFISEGTKVDFADLDPLQDLQYALQDNVVYFNNKILFSTTMSVKYLSKVIKLEYSPIMAHSIRDAEDYHIGGTLSSYGSFAKTYIEKAHNTRLL